MDCLHEITGDPARRGELGRALVEAVLQPVRHVRQQVLLTDDQPSTRAFYARLGWQDIADPADSGLRAFVRAVGRPTR